MKPPFNKEVSNGSYFRIASSLRISTKLRGWRTGSAEREHRKQIDKALWTV